MIDDAGLGMPESGRASVAHEGSLRDILHVLFRWRRTGYLTFAICTVLAILITILSPSTYRSDAKLLVRLGRESVILDPTAALGQVVAIQQSRENEINSELEILRSRELCEKLVQAIGPEKLASPGILGRLGFISPQSATDRAIARLTEGLHIEVLKDSNIVRVGYRASSPELAQQVVSKLIDLYLDKHIAAYRTRGSYEFFAVETKQLRESIQSAETRLRDVKNEANVGSLEEQRRILLARIGTLQQDIQQNNTALSAARAKIKDLRGSLATLPETVVTEQVTGLPNAGADGMREKLYELQLKEQDILSKFRDDSEPAREVRRQITEAEALLAQEQRARVQVTQGLNSAHQKVKEDLLSEGAGVSGLAAKVKSLAAELNAARKELRKLNVTEVELADLQRQLDIARENYRKYSENLEQARIDQALETERISNISVVQPATLIAVPVSPRKGLNLALGLFLGTFAGIGFAFFREFLDQTFRRPADVARRLQLPALVGIPCLPEASSRGLLRMGAPARRQLPGSVEATLQGEARNGLPRALVPGTYFETLRDYLTLNANGHFKRPCVLAVTGCRRGEGVSTIAASLAATLRRETRGRVLLLDARRLRPSERDGNVEFSAHEVDSDGTLVALDPEGWKSPSTPELFDDLKRDFSFVVVDTPALLETSAALRLCGMADGVILVVEAESTRWQVAQEAKEALKRANANVLGVVLNKRRFHVPGWLYEKL